MTLTGDLGSYTSALESSSVRRTQNKSVRWQTDELCSAQRPLKKYGQKRASEILLILFCDGFPPSYPLKVSETQSLVIFSLQINEIAISLVKEIK